MSDTPKTDNALIKGVVPQWSNTPRDMVPVEFARDLEREVDRLKQKVLDLDARAARADAEIDGILT